jgi:DNA-binding transcriptional MerR regulator/DNA gyrase inhibitor GyrI
MKVESEELLSIGRFARLSGLTVKALRHYDELGLLRPASVDEWTGYRFYSRAQGEQAIAIRRLRELDLPLEDVAYVLSGGPGALRERLAVHRARLEGRVAESRQFLVVLDRLIEGKEPLVPQQTIKVTLEEVPALRVAVIAAHVPVDDMFKHVPMTITSLIGWLDRHGVRCSGNPLILHLGIVDDALDVEVGWPIDAGLEGDEVVSIREVPAARAAVLEHRGPYEELPTLYQPLEDWIREQGLTPQTPIRELYDTNPNDTPDPQEWVTRIAWPVA